MSTWPWPAGNTGFAIAETDTGKSREEWIIRKACGHNPVVEHDLGRGATLEVERWWLRIVR